MLCAGMIATDLRRSWTFAGINADSYSAQTIRTGTDLGWRDGCLYAALNHEWTRMDTNAGAMMGKAGAETVIAHAGVQSRHTNAGTLIKFAQWTRIIEPVNAELSSLKLY